MKPNYRSLWLPHSRLPDAPRSLLGILELVRRPGAPALELHLARPRGGPCVGAWLDEDGRRWLVVEARRA